MLALLLAAVLIIENALLIAPGLVQFPPHRVAEGTVVAFLADHYFPAVLDDPPTAMTVWGTKDFQELKRRQGMDAYIDYYGNFVAIPATSIRVARVSDDTATNSLEVRFTPSVATGRAGPRAILMRVTCVDWWDTYVPTGRCSSDDLRLDYTHGLAT